MKTLSIMALNTVFAECLCRVLFKLSVITRPIMLSVVMLSAIMLNVVMLSVVAPFERKGKGWG
jgi:hypothetical protein